MAFLTNGLGFFIQLFPCALMIFLPFSPEAYRFRRKTVFIGITAVAAALSAAFSAVVCLRDMVRNPRYVAISNTFMLAAVLLTLAAYVWLLRESLLKKVLVFFIVMFYAVTEFVLVNVMHTVVWPIPPDDSMMYPYAGSVLLMYAATTALLLPLMLAAVIRPLKEYLQRIEPQNMRREFIITLLSTSVYFAMTV